MLASITTFAQLAHSQHPQTPSTDTVVNAVPVPPDTVPSVQPRFKELIPAMSRVSAEQLLLSIVKSETDPTIDDLLEPLQYRSGNYIREFSRLLAGLGTSGHDRPIIQRIKALRQLLEQAKEALAPKHYPHDVFTYAIPSASVGVNGSEMIVKKSVRWNDDCYAEIVDGKCNDRIAGFAAAAFYFTSTKNCWKGLDFRKSAAFSKGYLEWWHQHVKENDTCKRPSTPARCLLAVCWGGPDDYTWGVAFRPSLQFGTTLGEGLGFNESGGLAAQFSGSLGARAFGWDDKADVHAGIGIGTSSSSPSSDDVPNEGLSSRGFLAAELGLGFFSGIANVSYIHVFDPFSEDADTGNGLSFYVDAAALQRLSGTD